MTQDNPHPKDPQAELEKEMHKLGRELYNAGVFKQTIYGSSALTVDAHISQMLVLFQAHQQQLLSELLSHSKTLLDGMNVADFVPVSVIERKIGEVNG